MCDAISERSARVWVLGLSLWLSACTAVGPDYQRPTPAAPSDWSAWSSAGPELAHDGGAPGAPSGRWWEALQDPVLNDLEQQALAQNLDLRSAALHVAQARAQRDGVASQQAPSATLQADVARQRQSEYAASDRVLDIMAPANRDALASALSQPFNQYQAGVDLSWEADLWGRVRRAVEGAEADVAAAAALRDQVRVVLASDLADAYVDLRTTQQLLRLTRADIAAVQERADLMASRVRRGLVDDSAWQQQQLTLASLQADLPALLAQQAQAQNRIALLLGLRPGALSQTLAARDDAPSVADLPAYRLGLPSELAARRPDIRAAEARLHQATAAIGEAQAQLYPSVRLGANIGLDSYASGKFGDWGSRVWRIGPSLDLPLFDGGRRRAVVQLHTLQQQEVAIDFQRTVLRAWQEVDDALTAYAGAQLRQQRVSAMVQSSDALYRLTQSRARAGLSDALDVLDARHADLQVQRERVTSQGQMRRCFVAIYRALGGGAAQDAD